MKILVTHVFGYANKGDWILLKSLLDVLEEAFPGAEIRGICRDPDAQALRFPKVKWFKQAGVSVRTGIRRRVENVLGLAKAVADYSIAPVLKGSSDAKGLFGSCFRGVDLVVACPGGYLEDSNVSIITNLVHLHMALSTNAPVVLAPQSIGPFRSNLWAALTGSLLRRVQRIYVREEHSWKTVVERLGVPRQTVELAVDMALYGFESDQARAEEELRKYELTPGSYLAATVIDWYFPKSVDPGAARERYIRALAGVMRRLWTAHGIRTLLLKQVEAAAGVPGDDAVLNAVQNLAGEAVVVPPENYPPEVMQALIGASAAFLGSRMHSSVFAMQQGVPFVGIGYLPKTHGIMSMFGLGDYVCPIEEVSEDILYGMLVSAMSDRERFLSAQASIRHQGGEARAKLIRALTGFVRQPAAA
jgi:Uncharacterized conserved protein